MSLLGFKGRNHPQQIASRGADLSVDDRGTPPDFFDPLHERFAFTVDVAATEQNAKLPRFYDSNADGLTQDWAGERVWCNPPFSSIEPWVKKAWRADRSPLVVVLLPANRTEQPWWQDFVEPFRDRPGSPLTVEFIRGRTRFLAPGASLHTPNRRPPFGCCLAIWTREIPVGAISVVSQGSFPI